MEQMPNSYVNNAHYIKECAQYQFRSLSLLHFEINTFVFPSLLRP